MVRPRPRTRSTQPRGRARLCPGRRQPEPARRTLLRSVGRGLLRDPALDAAPCGLFDLDVAAFGIAGEDCGCSIAASLAERIVERAEFAMSFLHRSRPFAAESLWMPRAADLGWSPLLASPSRHDPLYGDGPTSSARPQPVPSTFISTRPLQEFVRITLGMSRDAEAPAPQQDAKACPLIFGMKR